MFANNEVLRLVSQATALPSVPAPGHYTEPLSMCLGVSLVFATALIVATLIRKK